MQHADKQVLMWFLKAPQPGKVKTRLAREIGYKAAADAYRFMVDKVWKALVDIYPSIVHFTPTEKEAAMKIWLGEKARYLPQVEGDLGKRLRSALDGYYRKDRGKVMLLGGDCPYLDRAYLRAAFCALNHVELVLGPALDGGYVLMGLKRCHPELFLDIPWSSSSVLECTLERAKTAGLSVKLLDPLEDVDDLASWKRAAEYLGIKPQNDPAHKEANPERRDPGRHGDQ